MRRVLTAALPTVRVATLSELTTALNRGDLDITITAPITVPAGGLYIPRIASGRTLRCDANGILVRGSMDGPIAHSLDSETGGRLTLVGVRADGGWRSDMHEDSDMMSNYIFFYYDFLRIDGCVSAYSYSHGWYVSESKQLEIENSVIFACSRDAVYEGGTRDYLFRNNLVQHCADDCWGTHQGSIGNNLVTKWILVENNTFRDAIGLKAFSGAASGTINGKPSGITIRNNTFEAGALYGFMFLKDVNWPQEPWAPPRNMTVENNTWKDVRITSRSSGGQVVNVVMNLNFPDTYYDSSLIIRNNTCIRNPSFDGQPLQNCYSWAQLNSPDKPQNVPGAGAFQGFHAKTGFQPDETFYLTTVGYRNDGGSNPQDITHSGNVWIGSGWTNTLS